MGRVGVITWFFGPNYGTNLQALALQKAIIQLGDSPELVNFRPPKVPKKKRKLSSKLQSFIPNQILKIKNAIVKKKFGENISIRDKKMIQIIEDNCTMSPFISNEKKYVEICNTYDALIFGSDQIWNPNWFHPFYYADYKEICIPRIAYAPSIGVSKIQDDMVDKYMKALKPFLNIAVREDSGVKYLNQITGFDCKKVVDPTLFLTASEWDELFHLDNIEENYVLLYLLQDNKNHLKAVINFVEKNKLKLKIIPYQNDTYFMNGELISDAGPKEFLELIKNADYVISDSFHAMVFSIIYKKEFYILTRFNDINTDSQNSRVYQIINEYGLHDRLQEFNTTVIEESKPIDYDAVYKILDKQIHFSMKYLKDSLKEVKANEQ